MSTKKHSRTKIKTRKQKKSVINGIVEEANKVEDLMVHLQQFEIYKTGNFELNISCHQAVATDKEMQDAVFLLLKTNMQLFYEQSDWGWKEADKKAELMHEHSKYLLAKDTDGKLVAFAHFRFDTEVNSPVLYCYELQVNPQFQRRGIGRFLMQLLSLIAYKMKLTKVMLTTFKHNQSALNFYTKSLGFRLDENSPRTNSAECYVILSKMVDKSVLCNFE